MSVVTLEQETLVMTELADEEISGLVGGGYKPSVFKPETKVNTEAKGKNVNIIVINQFGYAQANGGGNAVVEQNSYSEINNSKNKVKIRY